MRACSHGGETNYYKISALGDARALLADIAHHYNQQQQQQGSSSGGPRDYSEVGGVYFKATDGEQDVSRKMILLLKEHCRGQPDRDEDMFQI